MDNRKFILTVFRPIREKFTVQQPKWSRDLQSVSIPPFNKHYIGFLLHHDVPWTHTMETELVCVCGPFWYLCRQSPVHSASCQGETVLHVEAPMPLSNFTLQWIWAEHANPHITKQIKSANWEEKRGEILSDAQQPLLPACQEIRALREELG